MARAYQVHPDAFVIPESLPVPQVGVLPINAMILRGEQPMILDTLATVHREVFLEEAFNIVDPKDVRWIFLSHEDRDHSGSLAQTLAMCPNAKLITNFLGLGKLAEEFHVDPHRVHLMNDGDSLDIGDRIVTALRPPLYDSSATAGLWDPKSEIYYGADCFGAVTDTVPQFTDELSDADFEDGFFWMNRANHVWFEHIRPEFIASAAERVKALGARMLVSGHGPVERKNVARMCDWIKRVSDMKPVRMPNHEEFEAMLHAAE